MRTPDELKLEYEAKLKEAELAGRIEEEIFKKIGTRPRVYISDLYGRIASVEFGNDFGEKKISDPAEVERIMSTFTPEPCYLWKDSCTSFRCGNTGEGHNGRREFTGTIQEVNPYIINIKNCTQPHAVIEWFYKLESGEIVEIRVITVQYFFGGTSSRYHESRNMPKYTNSQFSPREDYRSWASIGWWSSGDYPADFTLYTTDKTKKIILNK